MLVKTFMLNLRFLGMVITYTTVAEGKTLSLNQNKSNFNPKKICETAECISAATFILTNMDQTVDPCDDFYKYACGSFAKESGTFSSSIIDRLKNEITDPQLIVMLKQKSDKDSTRLKKVKKFYSTCINQNPSKQDAAEYLKQNRTDIYRLIDYPFDTSPNWIETIQKSRDFGFPFEDIIDLGFESETISNDSFSPILTIGKNQPNLKSFVPNRDWFDINFEQSLTLENSYVSSNPGVSDNMQEKIKEFHRKIAKIKLISETSPQEMSIQKLQDTYPSINWRKILQALLGSTNNVDLSQTKLKIKSPMYIKNLENLMNQTDPNFVTRFIKFSNFIHLYNAMDPNGCLPLTIYLFGDLVGAKYVETFFQEKTKQSAENMVSMMKSEIIRRITSSEWLDDRIRPRTLKKLDNMKHFVGYHEYPRKEVLEKLYANLQMHNDSFSELYLNAAKYKADLHHSEEKLIMIRHADSLRLSIRDNVFYFLEENLLGIPATILTGVLYGNDRPAYLNYGFSGPGVGHQLLHLYGNKQTLCDKMERPDDCQWNQHAKNVYDSKTQCFSRIYDGYELTNDGKTINGTRTLEENIADNEGINVAYKSYKLWLDQKKYEDEQELPNLNCTPEQMFWISAANFWCSNDPDAIINQHIEQNGIHSPSMARVNVVFSNQKEFVNDFKCSLNSKMNSPEKCSLW